MDMICSIGCVSSSDGMEDDDALSSNLPRPFLKGSAAAIAAASIGVVPGGGGGASGAVAAGGITGPLIPSATSSLSAPSAPTPCIPRSTRTKGGSERIKETKGKGEECTKQR